MSMDFDPQAAAFDARAGLSAADLNAVAQAVIDLGRLDAQGVLLEVGAGTGEIGEHLLGRVRYLGLDASREMLREFRARAPSARLLHADANRPWPIATGAVQCVLMSRVAHLLDARVLLSELARVAHARGCTVLVGRRARDPKSLQRRLQHKLHELIEADGLVPRRGERDSQRLLDALCDAGAEPLEPVDACHWPVQRAPADFLRNWRNKPGLTGLGLADSHKSQLLFELEGWARDQWDDLEAPVPSTESYRLTGVRLCP